MPLNPSLKQETLNNPIHRGNPLNDPQYQNQQGYNNYDLTNSQLITPRFGEVTPFNVFETVPGDRHMLHGNGLDILNQIDSNLVSEINSYMDYFFVPMRCIYPINYEKIVPNPSKGDDIPDKALPMIPLLHLINCALFSETNVNIVLNDETYNAALKDAVDVDAEVFNYKLHHNQLLYVSYMLSRGSLLDYLGYSLDVATKRNYRKYTNTYQQYIDAYFDSLLSDVSIGTDSVVVPVLYGRDIFDKWTEDLVDLDSSSNIKVSYIPLVYGDADGHLHTDYTLSSFRAALYDALEKGLFIDIRFNSYSHDPGSSDYVNLDDTFHLSSNLASKNLLTFYSRTFGEFTSIFEEGDADPFEIGYINPTRLAAYQLSVAEYMSNDTIDNIFNAQLYMQNLRAIMYPTFEGVSNEPTFDYNGIATEYDLFTTGAFQSAFFGNRPGLVNRLLPFISNVFFLRRSLRYGDYFATGRPRLLAVGQLGIPVQNGNTVNPIDVTKNLVLQRFLNAVNWVGSRFVNYMTSIFGVKPQLTEPHPIFIAHRKVELNRNFVNNTANDQGKQVTNLKGETDNNAFDVFIDDFGVIIGVKSYDALPVYPSGIDANFLNSDRYSMFNAMLQNVGDQPIKVSELTGFVGKNGNLPMAYTVRYGQYKFGITRAHGAFVNSLPGYSMLYPWSNLDDEAQTVKLSINPDFIRDKPFFFDQFFASRTGMSPATYYHFIVSVNNVHSAARKMQYQPPVL